MKRNILEKGFMTRFPASQKQWRLRQCGTITIESTIILARLILVALALLLPIALIQTFASLQINTAPLEASILAYRLVTSPAGLGYFDAVTQQAPLGVIDVSKFETAVSNPAYLASQAPASFPKFGMKITIGSLSAYYNQQTYEDYVVLANTRLPGQGSADRISFAASVILRSPTGNSPDIPSGAIIDVVMPR